MYVYVGVMLFVNYLEKKIFLPRQLALIGHAVVAFCIKYAFSVVSDGLFRSVSSSFFHTYVMADCSYETKIIIFKANLNLQVLLVLCAIKCVQHMCGYRFWDFEFVILVEGWD